MRGRPEFAVAWTVILAAAVGVGLGTTGLPIYTTGQFIRPLGTAFGWSRSATAGGLIFLTIGNVLMAPVIGWLIERFGVRTVAMTAQLGLCAGYFSLTLNGGSLAAWYAGWAVLAVLGSGTSPIVWTRAVASWFERSRGLALGLTLCGTGVVAVIGPGLIGGIVASYGWQAGFYALSGAQLVVGLPVVFFLFRARDAVAGVSVPLAGLSVRQVLAGSRFWRLSGAFFCISLVVGGMIVSLPAMLADRGIALDTASRALGLMGGSIIVGRLAIGFLVDRMPARAVAPVFILLPVVSTLMLAHGLAPVPAVVLLGLAAGAEVDLLAYLISRYFGLLHYAKIYGWALPAFSAGAGVGPIFAGWVHDETGSYVGALYAFACSVTVAAGLIGTLGRPDPAFGGGR